MAKVSTPARKRGAAKPASAAAPAAGKSAPAKAAKNAGAPAKVARPPKSAKPASDGAGKRERLVRDSFTIPKGEYAELGKLKQRATVLARPAKKSELLRAGVKALAAMDDKALLAALQGVPALKTGRPSAGG